MYNIRLKLKKPGKSKHHMLRSAGQYKL